jgi:hypothetical protein
MKQREAIARQKAHGESLRAWLQDKAAEAAKRRRVRHLADQVAVGSRGVDRVPARYRTEAREVVWVHKHPEGLFEPRVSYRNETKDRTRAGKARRS